jgi:outer membrane protein insertion porin family
MNTLNPLLDQVLTRMAQVQLLTAEAFPYQAWRLAAVRFLVAIAGFILSQVAAWGQINFGQPATTAPNALTPPVANPGYFPQGVYAPQGLNPDGTIPVIPPATTNVQSFQPPVTYPSPASAPADPAWNTWGTAAPPSQPAWPLDPSITLPQPSAPTYAPRIRDVPIDVYVTEGQTGRFMLGGSVNSDLGVMGNITIEERNFDLFGFPRRPGDLFNGAFRGGGQNFRLELVPGNQVQRYTVNWTQPNLFGYSPFSLAVGGFLFSRFYRDWNEERLGGRVMLGYEVSPDLSLSTEIRAEDVDISDPRVAGVPQLERVLGSSDLYTGRVSLIHSTRDSPFLPTEGHYLELIYDQGFGEFDFPRGQVNFSRYFLIRQRPDTTGRQTLTSNWRLGFSGADTPIFENFFAGGFSTMRGFRFRGASPVESDVQVGGRFQFLGSLEYMFPLTADDMIRMVTFIDYGTIEQDIEFDWKNFRAAPGLGLRIAVPAMGPAPLAFDFAFPVLDAAGDQRQVFSFSMGLTR